MQKPPNKVLIVGKLPLPIGGVRIHVQRLIEELEKRGYANFKFYDLEKNPLYKILPVMIQYPVVHLHTSNPWFQLLAAVCSRLFRTRLIITYHSNWGRYGTLRNASEALSAFFARTPIVQNQESLLSAKKMNRHSILMSTFIPPVHLTPLRNAILQQIHLLQNQYSYLFCTNAWDLVFDKHGREVYGISDLIKSMDRCEQSVLIISDPSGHYQKFMKEQSGVKKDKVFWISEPHDFWHVLALSHAFIRNTTTDATSISIQEALCLHKVVFASATVSRAPECMVYQDVSAVHFEAELEKILMRRIPQRKNRCAASTVDQLLSLYQDQLGRL